MQIKYKQISWLFVIITSVLFQISCNLFDNNIGNNSNASDVQQSNTLVPVKSFKNCENENSFLRNLMKQLKGNNQLLSQKHKSLKDDQMQWDIFIANYNQRVQIARDSVKTVKFNCVAQHLVDNMMTASVMIGFYYIDGPTSKSRFYEDKFEEFRLAILNNMKETR